MISALSALAHNARLVDNAENVLKALAENENCFLYLVNPDGTRVRILPGVRIESYEMATPIRLEEQNT